MKISKILKLVNTNYIKQILRLKEIINYKDSIKYFRIYDNSLLCIYNLELFLSYLNLP